MATATGSLVDYSCSDSDDSPVSPGKETSAEAVDGMFARMFVSDPARSPPPSPSAPSPTLPSEEQSEFPGEQSFATAPSERVGNSPNPFLSPASESPAPRPRNPYLQTPLAGTVTGGNPFIGNSAPQPMVPPSPPPTPTAPTASAPPTPAVLQRPRQPCAPPTPVPAAGFSVGASSRPRSRRAGRGRRAPKDPRNAKSVKSQQPQQFQPWACRGSGNAVPLGPGRGFPPPQGNTDAETGPNSVWALPQSLPVGTAKSVPVSPVFSGVGASQFGAADNDAGPPPAQFRARSRRQRGKRRSMRRRGRGHAPASGEAPAAGAPLATGEQTPLTNPFAGAGTTGVDGGFNPFVASGLPAETTGANGNEIEPNAVATGIFVGEPASGSTGDAKHGTSSSKNPFAAVAPSAGEASSPSGSALFMPSELGRRACKVRPRTRARARSARKVCTNTAAGAVWAALNKPSVDVAVSRDRKLTNYLEKARSDVLQGGFAAGEAAATRGLEYLARTRSAVNVGDPLVPPLPDSQHWKLMGQFLCVRAASRRQLGDLQSAVRVRSLHCIVFLSCVLRLQIADCEAADAALGRLGSEGAADRSLAAVLMVQALVDFGLIERALKVRADCWSLVVATPHADAHGEMVQFAESSQPLRQRESTFPAGSVLARFPSINLRQRAACDDIRLAVAGLAAAQKALAARKFKQALRYACCAPQHGV